MNRYDVSTRRRQYVARDPALTSRIMAAVRATDNRAEVALRKALWRLGYRYRLYDRKLPGSPDLVFRSRKAVIFVDGDFWHGRILVEKGSRALRSSFRTKRRSYWVQKIHRNVRRDSEVTAALKALGWRVLRLWERDVLAHTERIVTRAARFLG